MNLLQNVLVLVLNNFPNKHIKDFFLNGIDMNNQSLKMLFKTVQKCSWGLTNKAFQIKDSKFEIRMKIVSEYLWKVCVYEKSLTILMMSKGHTGEVTQLSVFCQAVFHRHVILLQFFTCSMYFQRFDYYDTIWCKLDACTM